MRNAGLSTNRGFRIAWRGGVGGNGGVAIGAGARRIGGSPVSNQNRLGDVRDNMLKSLAHKTPDWVPCDYLGTQEVDQRLREYFGLPQAGPFEVEEGIARWSAARGEALEGVLDRLGTDIRQVNPECRPYAQRLPDGGWKDIWGVSLRMVHNDFGAYAEPLTAPLAEIKTLEDVERYPWPSPDWYDYSCVHAQCLRYEGYAIKAGGPGVPDLLNGTSRGRGMEQVFLDIASEDPVGLAILNRRFAFYREFTRRTLAAGCGRIDIFWIGDDFGSQGGLLLSPGTWRRVFKPYLRELINLIHSFNAKAMLHSCGSTRLIWDDLAELGLDIYQTVQERAKDMDPEQLKATYGGRISLHGAIDSQGFLQTARPEEVKRKVRERMRTLGRNGGYICSSCHNLQPDIPVENIVAMYEALHET